MGTVKTIMTTLGTRKSENFCIRHHKTLLTTLPKLLAQWGPYLQDFTPEKTAHFSNKTACPQVRPIQWNAASIHCNNHLFIALDALQMVILAGIQAPPWDWPKSTSANTNALRLYDQDTETLRSGLLKIKPYAVPVYRNKHSKHNSWSQSLCYTHTCAFSECI